MKRITVTLTEDQANMIWRVLEWAYEEPDGFGEDPGFTPETARSNAYIRRLRNKIARATYGNRAKIDTVES